MNNKRSRLIINRLLGDSCRIQTCNLLIRSQMLYSIELTSRRIKIYRDSCRIQTCNLLIRSQMLYSIELTNHAQRFRFASAKLKIYSDSSKFFYYFFYLFKILSAIQFSNLYTTPQEPTMPVSGTLFFITSTLPSFI